jgi:hypothetical protein
MAHERVHVLQGDFLLTAWSEPLTLALLRPVPGGRFLTRYAALDVLDWVVGTLNRIIYDSSDFSRFPTELEAEFLSGR